MASPVSLRPSIPSRGRRASQKLAEPRGRSRRYAASRLRQFGTAASLATDGGLHATSDGGNSWTYAGGGRAGYNALQVTEIKGQLIEDVGRHDPISGRRTTICGAPATAERAGPTGRAARVSHRGRAPRADERAVQGDVRGLSRRMRKLRIRSRIHQRCGLVNSPGEVVGNAMILRRSVHLQGAETRTARRNSRSPRTSAAAGSNSRASPDDRRDLPKLASHRGGLRVSMVYQAYRAPGWAPGGVEINHLLRVRKNPRLPGLASVLYPAMTNFGGLGINPTMFAWYQVYAVEPADAYHVIAPDVVNNRAMETVTGGRPGRRSRSSPILRPTAAACASAPGCSHHHRRELQPAKPAAGRGQNKPGRDMSRRTAARAGAGSGARSKSPA